MLYLQVLSNHTPKNIKTHNKGGGAKMPCGVARYLSTSSEHMAILEERAGKSVEQVKPTKSAKCAKPAKSAKPAMSAKLVKSAKLSKSSKPAESDKPVNLSKSSDCVMPVIQEKSPKPTKTTQKKKPTKKPAQANKKGKHFKNRYDHCIKFFFGYFMILF